MHTLQQERAAPHERLTPPAAPRGPAAAQPARANFGQLDGGAANRGGAGVRATRVARERITGAWSTHRADGERAGRRSRSCACQYRLVRAGGGFSRGTDGAGAMPALASLVRRTLYGAGPKADWPPQGGCQPGRQVPRHAWRRRSPGDGCGAGVDQEPGCPGGAESGEELVAGFDVEPARQEQQGLARCAHYRPGADPLA